MTFHHFTPAARTYVEQLAEAVTPDRLREILNRAYEHACERQPGVTRGEIDLLDIEATLNSDLTPYDGIVAVGGPDPFPDDLGDSKVYDNMPLAGTEPEQEAT
jgi:hypothetical protein